ncbi:MAG: Choline trimethylamine-lyase [Syntrophomonadaceae bacterium]|nr:Choline trimethylamine-lyase [Bacillota bacterium]
MLTLANMSKELAEKYAGPCRYLAKKEYIVRKCVELYEASENIRAKFCPTPYLSCFVRGCAEKGLDITQGGAELNFTTIEGVTFATTVDSILAIKYLVFDKKECTMLELISVLKNNWVNYDVLQAMAKYKAPNMEEIMMRQMKWQKK